MDGINDTANSTSSAVVCKEYTESPFTQASKTLVYIVIITISVVGNSTVVYVVYRNLQERTMTNWFIANLAASDILITVTAMPNMITELYISHWIFGSFVCKMVVYLQSVAVAVSVLTLLAVTGDRYLCVVRPLKPRPSVDSAKYIVALIWIVGSSIMAPLIDAQRVQESPNGYSYCIEEWGEPFDPQQAPKDFTIILFVVMYVLPLLGMAVLYLSICRTLWKRKVPGEHISQTEILVRKSRRKVFKMLVTVTMVFAACWLPLWVFQFIMFFAPHALQCLNDIKVFYFISLFLGHSNSAINPFLYSFFNVSFRNGFKHAGRCFRCFVPTRSNSRVMPSPAVITGTAQYTLRVSIPPSTANSHAYNNKAVNLE